MDRITYISRFGKGVTNADIEQIGEISEINNARDQLSGALLCYNGVFYQILEGPPETLYTCFNRIKKDPRHQDIFILDIQRDIEERLYPQWKMKTVFLEKKAEQLMTPIRDLLSAMTSTHEILRKYVPREILDGIQNGLNPLEWEMELDESVVMFCDLVGFSIMLERARVDEVKRVLNQYFGHSLSAVINAGGSISKLLGDGFLAYFPIDKANSALESAKEIIRAQRSVRDRTSSPFEKLCYCAVGLSAGPVLKGNTGSAAKMDYTLIGDVVNTASRLESYTREVGYSIIFDHRFKKYLDDTNQYIPLGTLIPKGKSQELNIFTLDDPMVSFDKTPEEISNAIRSINRPIQSENRTNKPF
jgi:class 3 adenylate cyclase